MNIRTQKFIRNYTIEHINAILKDEKLVFHKKNLIMSKR